MSYDVSPNRRGFRIPPQWIIAGILALVGMFQYFGRTQINPVTGEKQFRVTNFSKFFRKYVGHALAEFRAVCRRAVS